MVTIDVLFEDHALYQRVKATGVLNAALFAKLYGVAEADVLFTPVRHRGSVQGDAAAFWFRRVISATRMSMARSSTRRCWMSISRSTPSDTQK